MRKGLKSTMGTYTKEECLKRIATCKDILNNFDKLSNLISYCTYLFWVCTLLSYKACLETGVLNKVSVSTKYGKDIIMEYRNMYAHCDVRFFLYDTVEALKYALSDIEDEDLQYYLSKLN